MTAPELEHVDATLMLVAEARDRAERALRELGPQASESVAAALDRAERDLLALHTELHRSVYFPAQAEAQLKLAG